jgi:U3 small nucleolar RNA-associated protein 4
MPQECLVWILSELEDDDSDSDSDTDMEETPVLKIHGGEKKKTSILRLFSAGHDGCIREWDLVTLRPKSIVDANGGAIWSLAPNQKGTQIAVGCEDGTVRIFNVTSHDQIRDYEDDDSCPYVPSLELQKVCDKSKGRVLSLAWNNEDKYLYSGGTDACLRKIDVTTGRIVQRSSLEKDRQSNALVWAVKVLADSTVVTGDSNGRVQFWNPKTGVLLKSFKSHDHDILTLAVGDNGKTVYSAGTDQVIVQYKKINSQVVGRQNQKEEWISCAQKRYHSHAIKSLAIDEGRYGCYLISGGVDAQLTTISTSEFPVTHTRRVSPFLENTLCEYLPSVQLIKAQLTRSIKIWQLDPIVIDDPNAPGSTEVMRKSNVAPRLLFEVKPKLNSNIVSSSLSPDGKWLLISDDQETRMYRVSAAQESLKKVNTSTFFPPASRIIFSPNGHRLIFAGLDSKIHVFDWNSTETGFLLNNSIPFYERKAFAPMIRDTMSNLAMSQDGAWLSVGDASNKISVYNMDTLQLHTTLPSYTSQHTTMTFLNANLLFVSFGNNEFTLFDMETKMPSELSKGGIDAIAPAFRTRRDLIKGASLNHSSKIIVYGASYVCAIDLEKVIV